MPRDERDTCRELIEPALTRAGWDWEEQLRIGPGRVNLTGDTMYDETQAIIADYLLRYRSVPLAILEAKARVGKCRRWHAAGVSLCPPPIDPAFVCLQWQDWILTDNDTGDFETLSAHRRPTTLVTRMGVSIDWDRWEDAFSAGFHIDQVSRRKFVHTRIWPSPRPYGSLPRVTIVSLLFMATGHGKDLRRLPARVEADEWQCAQRQHVLFLTDRNSLKDQAYRAVRRLLGRRARAPSKRRPSPRVSTWSARCFSPTTRPR